MAVSNLLSVQGVNMLFSLKKGSAFFAAGVLWGNWFVPAFAMAESQPDKLMLKSSVQLVLNKAIDADKKLGKEQATRSVLANLELFRGVTVDLDPPAHADIQSLGRTARKRMSVRQFTPSPAACQPSPTTPARAMPLTAPVRW